MSESFKRVVEDFTCSQCGAHVTGNGFTDHCPSCLFSQHVDNTPGDRASTCGGVMEPISIAPERSGYVISYKCQSCGYEYSNKASDNDDVTGFIEKQGDPNTLVKRLPPL